MVPSRAAFDGENARRRRVPPGVEASWTRGGRGGGGVRRVDDPHGKHRRKTAVGQRERRRKQKTHDFARAMGDGGSGTGRPKDRGKEGGETRGQSVQTGKEQKQVQTRTEETSVHHGKQRGKETKRDAETGGRETENGRAMATDEDVCRRPERADAGTVRSV